MITFKKAFFRIILGIIAVTCYSCSSQNDILQDLTEENNSLQMHKCLMNFNASKKNYDNEPETRGSSSWQNGDRVYLTFTSTSGQKTNGYAEYSDSSWIFNYYGIIDNSGTAQCTAVYFDNSDSETGSVVNLTESTGIYEDGDCIYSLNNGLLSVAATLKPKTGRIRFTGNAGDKIMLFGITHYTAYDWTTGKYSESIYALTEEIINGTTPYIYGYLSNSESPRINLITETSGYTRPLSTTLYSPGKSGYMSIPTTASHLGWQNTLKMIVNDVEFTMIPVENGSNSFLLGETVVTEQLYNAVMGETATTSQLPIANLAYSNYKVFLDKLSDLTGFEFRMPTENEWRFAAKGGSKSNNYTYSGSNILSEVGWYKGNSGGSLHEVKQLKPNELGFYDMSGNVFECLSYVGSYYKPTLGGSYDSLESDCANSFRGQDIYETSKYDDLGLRIALSNVK